MSEVVEKKVTKLDAVRQAILAGKGSADEGVAWIKNTFDLDITKPMFSSYKSKILGGEQTDKPKRGRKKEFSPVKTNGNGNGHANLVEHVQLAMSMQKAIEKYGVDTVRTVLDLATGKS